jgi:FRG domain
MVAQFRSGVTRLGVQTSLGSDQLAWLESARHHGLPAPLLDFSWSPFVALFFACDGVRDGHEPPQKAAVYALNLKQLAQEMARRKGADVGDLTAFSRAMDAFLSRGAARLNREVPKDE